MPHANRNRFLIALGSNADDDISVNASLLNDALAGIKRHDVTACAVSPFYRTPAFPVGAGPDFANACAWVEAAMTPEALLAVLHAVEAAMGRVRLVRWGQRVIDLDLLAAGDAIVPDRGTVSHWMDLSPALQRQVAPPVLIVPHPRLHQRGFVLVPLADVAPDWVHPVLGHSVRALLAALDPAETAAIRPI